MFRDIVAPQNEKMVIREDDVNIDCQQVFKSQMYSTTFDKRVK